MVFTVTNKYTGEVVAICDSEKEEQVIHNDYELNVYESGIEPAFDNVDGKLFIAENSVFMKMNLGK